MAGLFSCEFISRILFYAVIYLFRKLLCGIKRHFRLIGGYGLAPDKCFPLPTVARRNCGLLPHSFHPYLLQRLKLLTQADDDWRYCLCGTISPRPVAKRREAGVTRYHFLRPQVYPECNRRVFGLSSPTTTSQILAGATTQRATI